MANEVKGSVLTLRITETMHEELRAAAANNGRSVSQEVERRISNSFLSDPNLGGIKQAALLSDLAVLMDAASMVAGQAWMNSHASWLLVRDGWKYLLSLVEPVGDPDFIDQMTPSGRSEVARWEHETEVKTQNSLRNARHLAQLNLKEKAFMLEPTERQWKELLEMGVPTDPIAMPSLVERDMQLWHRSEEQKVLRRRLWSRAEPILQLASRRFDSTDGVWEA